MTNEIKTRLRARLRRVAGQVNGIDKMIEDDRYCIDILMQIAAARAALTKVGQLLLEDHLESCVMAAFDSGNKDERHDKIEELIEVFSRYTKV